MQTGRGDRPPWKIKMYGHSNSERSAWIEVIDLSSNQSQHSVSVYFSTTVLDTVLLIDYSISSVLSSSQHFTFSMFVGTPCICVCMSIISLKYVKLNFQCHSCKPKTSVFFFMFLPNFYKICHVTLKQAYL